MHIIDNHKWVGVDRSSKRFYSKKKILYLLPDEYSFIVDLGCGNNKFIARQNDVVFGLDFAKSSNTDKHLDLVTQDWEIKPGSVDLVYANHFIEHLDYNERQVIFEKVNHILKESNIFLFNVPHFRSMNISAFDHKITNYGHATVWAIANANWYGNGITPYDVKSIGLNVNFGGENKFLGKLINKLFNYSYRLSEKYLYIFFGGIDEIQYVLTKKP